MLGTFIMWIETSEQVCLEIRKKHKEDLTVFGSFTDSDGDGYEWSSGRPEILTEWGFRKSENPTYKVLMTKDTVEDKKWKYEYFLYCA